MKSIRTIAAYLVVLALSGVVSLKSAEPGRVQTKAIVRTVVGNVTYTTAAGVTYTLKPNMELEPGATITTGPDSKVYVNINGLSSSVCIQADTTMTISQMERVGSSHNADSVTFLDLKAGAILGDVKKVSGNSQYEIKTPHGVAGIRGTDFQITVTLLPDGTYQVTFTSVQGTVIASAVVSGATQVKTLNTGESWTPGSDVLPTPVALLTEYQNLIATMIAEITPAAPTVTTTVSQTYPTGGTPNGQPSSPNGSTP